jgi:DNA-binding transcriptional regulator YdaS (Cro superfamily)
MIAIIKSAAQRVGGVPALAARLGVSRQALYQWQRIPAEKVSLVARETGLAEHQLRPDLYVDSGRSGSPTYEEDFAAWALAQSAMLRSGSLGGLDIDRLCEEIDDLARRERDEIESRLAVLLVHLLKLRFQAEKRSPSWDSTILEQRARIARRLARSPSLRTYPAAVLAEEYDLARREAAIETGLPLSRFPVECPFAIADILDLDFVPAPAG